MNYVSPKANKNSGSLINQKGNGKLFCQHPAVLPAPMKMKTINMDMVVVVGGREG